MQIYPSLLSAARIVGDADANGITVHVREDPRHFTEMDRAVLLTEQCLPVNLKMTSATPLPTCCPLIQKKREERSSERGLDAYFVCEILSPLAASLHGAAIRVSLFIAPDQRHVDVRRRPARCSCP